jgi:RNA polymerase sigma-70 factor (ECF subfamily)
MVDWTDHELVAHAQGGNVDAIESLYDRHRTNIFRYIWSRVGEQRLAEDLTGDVFMRMLAALPDYRATERPFRAWLYRIAHNLLVDHIRKEKQHASIPLDAIKTRHANGSDPMTALERRSDAQRVHDALSKLDTAQREVIVLRFLCELSPQEVAQILGKTEAAVKSMQHRSLAALRQVLAEEQVTL